ncbi:MAG: DUF1028 domain-containing protein, partial [Rhodobacteraceae bacterium]|nr:DUF1028 domain-containing protein [Paracoccaceae bacterium]
GLLAEGPVERHPQAPVRAERRPEGVLVGSSADLPGICDGLELVGAAVLVRVREARELPALHGVDPAVLREEPERLLQALEAGLANGGEAGPVRSAGLKVADRLDWPLIDLRIDWADDPIGMLRAAWDVYAPQMAAYVQRAEYPTQAPSYGVPGDE